MDDPIYIFRGNYYFLSNFYPCKVKYEGKVYPSAENAFQAAKTLSPEVRKMFTDITPGQAKHLGRKVGLRPMWEIAKLGIMEDILRIKFQDRWLHDSLLDTYPARLIEGNNWGDEFWGMVYHENPPRWKGRNHLGRILMKLRKELMDGGVEVR